VEVSAAVGPGWMDNILNFFLSDLQNLEERAKKFIELRESMLNKSRIWSL
jgi:hypothetical protein